MRAIRRNNISWTIEKCIDLISKEPTIQDCKIVKHADDVAMGDNFSITIDGLEVFVYLPNFQYDDFFIYFDFFAETVHEEFASFFDVLECLVGYSDNGVIIYQ